jgi:DNA-binding LacI/PurR family transcriptional regulator
MVLGRRQGRVSIIDVAAAAGVSRQTVSNAVNAPERLSPETLARVNAEILRLGFRPSRAARILKQERAGAWGMQLDSRGEHRLGSILDEFLVHLTRRSRAHDSHIVPFAAGDLDPLPAYDDLVASRIADGFVLADTRHADPRPAHLAARGIPFAAFGRIWDDPDQTRWVDVDGAAGVANAVHHLHGGGWDRIGFLGWPAGSPVGDNRRSGWAQATQDLDVHRPEWVVETNQDVSGAAQAAAPVIDHIGRGGALVCASDVLAVGAWEVLAERGWRVGRDFALVGFDDSPLAASLRLTSIRQPLDVVAEHVLQLLGNPERDGPPQGVLLNPELVIRVSSTPAGNRATEGSTT